MDYKIILKTFKQKYIEDGIEIISIFGSVAKNEDDLYSDLDIAYNLDKKFFKKYKDGFSQILRIEDIKKELEKAFNKKVDFIPLNNKIKKGLVYV